jgi:hypothetical protein
LHQEFASLVKAFITSSSASASAAITSLLEFEDSYINMDHPSFIGIQSAWQEHIHAATGLPRSETGASVESDGLEGQHGFEHRDGMHGRARSTPTIGAAARHHVSYFHMHPTLMQYGSFGGCPACGDIESSDWTFLDCNT